MIQDINRSEERKKACIHAFATDLTDSLEVKCLIRDVSSKGCRIISSRVCDLPRMIQLIPEGFDNPITGVVVWRRRNVAGVCFEHGCSDDVRSDIAKRQAALTKEAEEDVLVLGRTRQPLGYGERMKKYRGQRELESR